MATTTLEKQPVTEPVEESVGSSSLVAAAGLVTTLFGLQGLLGLLGLVAMMVLGFEDTINTLGFATVVAQGFLFVVLGYGVSRHSIACVNLTLLLTAVIVVVQLYTALTHETTVSVFMILIAPAVGVLNYLALRQLRAKRRTA